MSLKEYRKKRDFERTKEPKGGMKKGSGRRFVIQKHAASRLHYDFRLELGGTLKSWAVPKGVPYSKGEKRLAVQVEDHPVSYIDFEGTIPKGEYGGGTVMVWDKGTYEPLTRTPEKDLAGGKLHVSLHGEKLSGEWYLVRLRDEKNWLLFKGKENMHPLSKVEDDTSALSGRNMESISRGGAVWHSKRNERSQAKPKMPKASRFAKRASFPLFPRFVEPMKARLSDGPLPGNWIYEVKFDGFRALAFKNGSQCRLLSRNDKDFSGKFPQVFKAIEELDLEDVIIDGEIVALDNQGRSSFQLLQAYDLGQEKPRLFYYVFDLLRLDGKDLRDLPVTERKAILEKAVTNAPNIIRFSISLTGDVSKLLKEAAKLNLEGIIGKRANSTYEAGRRSGSWIKIKLHQEQEMVIGGYTDPEGSRTEFGSLLIGYYENGKLLCAGKVGTGFNDALLRSLGKTLRSIPEEACPFTNLPEKRAGRYGAGITRAVMKRCHWVKPKLVCQVRFSEWTRDGKLRQPAFLGLRDDKSAKEVVREKAT
jgi:bifunctional non-homologous end joining protein LigD